MSHNLVAQGLGGFKNLPAGSLPGSIQQSSSRICFNQRQQKPCLALVQIDHKSEHRSVKLHWAVLLFDFFTLARVKVMSR